MGSTDGDFKIGNSAFRLAIGVAVDGGGAGDIRMYAKGGTNRLILGADNTGVLTVRTTGVGIAAGGLHVGGTSDPGEDNLLVDGDATIAGEVSMTSRDISFYAIILRTTLW